MIFRCKNCGANVVYSPERGRLYCPYCDSTDSEELAMSENMETCINCGGELKPGDYNSAVKCEHCGSYVILKERITGEYTPHLILPFKIGKEKAQQMLKEQFGKKPFIPSDFLSDAKLSLMEGMYVPFFLYDFYCKYYLTATGKKVRTWRTGNKEYTETSLYRIVRDMDIDFLKIPADASYAMNDEIMDLMEPYDYHAMEQFQAKYMSGFMGERYNMNADTLEPRARKKARQDADQLMNDTITGYTMVMDKKPSIQMDTKNTDYVLLPVWNYNYTYKGNVYSFKVNGQTGKMAGAPPISIAKVILYGLTVFASTGMIGMLIRAIMGV